MSVSGAASGGPLSIPWPSLPSLSHGAWAALIQDSKFTHASWHQAQTYKDKVASSRSSASTAGRASESSRADRASPPAAVSGQSADADGTSSSAASANSDDADAGASSQLLADAELQTTSFLIANRAPAAAAATDDEHDQADRQRDGTGTSGLHIPPRLLDRWQSDVTDLSLDNSSFGGLYQKRLGVLQSLFIALSRHQQQRNARDDEQATITPPAVASAPPHNFFKRVLNPSNEYQLVGLSPPAVSDAVLQRRRGGLPGNENSSPDAPADGSNAPSTLAAASWSSLAARDPASPDWTSELPTLVRQLAALPPLHLRHEHTAVDDISTWMQSAYTVLPDLNAEQAGWALAAIVGVAIQAAQPSMLLAAVRALRTSSKGVLPAEVTPLLRHLSSHQNQLDISAPFSSALQFNLSQPLPSASSQAAGAAAHMAIFASRGVVSSSANGLACDASFLYVHTRDGLEKIGSGFHGTIRGHRYAYRADYRPTELVRVCAIDGKLYCHSSRMVWPRVEVLDAGDLHTVCELQLGIDPEFAAPNAPNKNGPSHLMTDGKYLYMLHAEDVDESVDECAAGECANSLLSLLGELEESNRRDVSAADMGPLLEEVANLREDLHDALEERAELVAHESVFSPRQRTVARQAAAERRAKRQSSRAEKRSAAQSSTSVEPIAEVQDEAKEQEEEKTEPQQDAPQPESQPESSEPVAPSVSPATPVASPSAAAPATPATPLVAATPAKKEANSSNKGFYASWNARNKLAATSGAPDAPPLTGGFVTPTRRSPTMLSKVRDAQQLVQRLLAHTRADIDGQKAIRPVAGAKPTPVVAKPPSPATATRTSGKLDFSSPSASPSSSSTRKKACRLSLYIYDPSCVRPISDSDYQEDLFLTQDESAARLSAAASRVEAAREISEAFGSAYSVRICITALKKCRDDKNSASRWLLDSGEDYRRLSCIPLRRSLVIANVQPQLTGAFLMQNVSTYVTPTQLVLLAPPHAAPWTNDRALALVISLEDGLLFEEYSGLIGRTGGPICFDAANNLIWAGQLQHSVAISAYTNHGPAGRITAESGAVAASTCTAENVASSLPGADELTRASDVALFLLTQADRNLKHRDISTASEPPVADAMRAHLLALTTELEVARTEVDLLKHSQTASDDAASLLDALPSMDVAESNEFPASTGRAELESHLTALLSTERTTLTSMVKWRNDPNRVSSSSRRTRDTIVGVAQKESRTAAQRLAAAESRITALESQLASDTTRIEELSRSSSSSFCPRAHTQPFCIDVSDESFTQLFRLMSDAVKADEAGATSGDAGRIRSHYTTEVCLRMLQVHLELLLKYTRSTDSLPTITHAKDIRTLLLDLALTDEDTGADDDVIRTSSVAALPPSIKSLSCTVLISGIRIFYPSQQDRVALLTDLMRDFQSPIVDAAAASANAGTVAPANKKLHLLQGILKWFSGQTSIVDTLLANPSTPTGTGGDSDADRAKTASPSPSPAGGVDVTAFARSLLDYSLAQEFHPFQAKIRSLHLQLDNSSPEVGDSGVKLVAASAVPPCIALMLVLQQDLIIQSGLLFEPSECDAIDSHHQQLTALAIKTQQLARKLGVKTDIPGLIGAAAAAAASSSTQLPSASPQLIHSTSSAGSAVTVWNGLQPNLLSDASSSESSFEESNAASPAAETAAPHPVQSAYFDRLLEYTDAVIDRCARLIDTVTAEEMSAGGAQRPASCVSYILKNSILLLLPSLLTSLGSRRIAAYTTRVARLLPSLHSLLTKIDLLNSQVPSLRSEDAKYSRRLANEHTKSYEFESPHPYPSGYRVLKQTLHIPGATHISWSFDPRSCTANGNDALRFYSDAAMKQPIGAAFYGNDRDGNSTWSRTTVLTPGDTVTICFSAKSQTKRGPDRTDQSTRFGFKCIARGVFLHSLPWLLDLQQTVTGLMARVIQHQLAVTTISEEEASARHWFQYGMLRQGLEETRLAAVAPGTDDNAVAAPVQSAALSFLYRFVDGADDTQLLQTELDRHPVSFAGKVLLKRLPASLQTQWTRAMRATMAAMIKHAGLMADVYDAFGSTDVDAVESPGRTLLLGRLKLISVTARSLQNWMMEQVQLHNEWTDWFSSTRMSHQMQAKKKVIVTTKNNAAADAKAKVATVRATIDLLSAISPARIMRQSGDDDESVRSGDDEMMDERDFSASDEDDYEDEVVDASLSAATAVPAHRSSADRDSEQKEAETKQSEDVTPVLPAATESEPEPIELESAYTFLFSLNDLKDQYGTHASKVKSLCAIKRIPLRSSESGSFDLDDALSRLFAALDRERREKESHARLHPSSAYHTIEPAVIKHNSYATVIDQVYSMSRALIWFKAAEEQRTSDIPTTIAATPVSPVPAVDDPLGMTPLMRTQSELPVYSADALPTVLPSTLESRTLSREVHTFRPPANEPIENRAEDLRSWLHTYARWKSWQSGHANLVVAKTPSATESTDAPAWMVRLASPIDAVKNIIRAHLDAPSLISIARQHQSRGAARHTALLALTSALDSITFEVGRVNLVGLLPGALTMRVARDTQAHGPDVVISPMVGGILNGLELANSAVKSQVQSAHESLMLVLLSLMKSTPPRTSSPAQFASGPVSPSSSLFLTDAMTSPPRRNCYASRLLALTDIFSLPFSPLLTTDTDDATPTSSTTLRSSSRVLFHLLTDAMSVKRYLRRLAPSLASEAAGDDQALLSLLMREAASEKEEADLRRAQVELAAQIEESKQYRARREAAEAEAKALAAAAAAAAAAEKAAASQSASSAAVPDAPPMEAANDESMMGGFNLFGDDDDAPADARSESDATRERRVAQEKERAEREYMIKIQRQFGDGGDVPAARERQSDEEESVSADGHMSVVQNRHGQKKAKWMKGAKPREENRGRPSQDEQRPPQDGDNVRSDAEDDVPPESESGGPSSDGTTQPALPSVADLNSAFASREWSALRLSLHQLLQWSESRVRAEIIDESEATKTTVMSDLRALRSSVLRQLTRELVGALGLARTLAAQRHSWAVRSPLLDLLEQLLTFFLYISPAAFESSAHAAPSGALGLTIIEIVHESQALTPRITLVALRLARRLLPALDPDAIWRNFTAQHTRAEATPTDDTGATVCRAPIVGNSLSEWLVHRIGAIITAESREQFKASQASEYQKRQQRRAELQQAAATAVRDPADTASVHDQKESESKESESTSAPSSSPKSHALVVHYQDAITTEKWCQILSLPAFLELAYGVRGILPPSESDIKTRATCEFERRQQSREGPSKVSCVLKSGTLDTAENRLTSRSGFSTFISNVGVSAGRWYYQIQLHTRGLLQVGWCTASHQPSCADGQGVGDDEHSWAYDGMRLRKWHGGQDVYSTSRWNSGDVIGCLLDLDTPGGEMSFVLNGESLGVAYANFYTPSLGPLYPAASISTHESATWIFDPEKMMRKGSMRSRVPDGYSTLEGDRLTFSDPVPMRRAAEVTRAVDFAGHFSLIEGDFDFCASMARRLASEHNITATVQLCDQLDSLALVDPSQPNVELIARKGPAAFPKQVWTGTVARACASELIAIARFLLDPVKSSEVWSRQMADTMRHAVRQPTQTGAGETAPTQESNTLLGSLCVLGGFTESIRVGGLVRVTAAGGDSSSAAARGIVVQNTDSHLRAVYLQELLASPSSAAAVPSHLLSSSQAVAVPELVVDLDLFPLDESTFDAFRARIEADASVVVQSEVQSSSDAASLSADASESIRHHRWLVGELKWRSVAVLESLLTYSSGPPRQPRPSHAAASNSGEMLIRIGELLVSHARECPLELKLDLVSSRCQDLERRWWNIRNCVDHVVAPAPFMRGSGVAPPASSSPSPTTFESVYSSSSYQEEKKQAAVDDDGLLRYWEKHIIPGIQNYVRGSFKPYEMDNFFAQLRQPLRANNQAGAIEIALTLTGGHIPDSLQFPDESRDFLTLALDDVRIGGLYLVTASAATTDLWLPCQEHTRQLAGRAKAVHPGEELVLLQFYDHQQGIFDEYWYAVECLKPAQNGAARRAMLHADRHADAVLAQLESSQSHLSSLLARRAIFTLLSRGGPASDRFLQHELSRRGLDATLEWIFRSVSESLELSDIARLGEATTNAREAVESFTNNVISFINQQRAGSNSIALRADASPITATDLCQQILRTFESFLTQAARFSQSQTTTTSFTLQPAPSVALAPGSAPPPPDESGDLWTRIKVDHASALILMYSKDTRLSKGSMLSVHPDEAGSELVKSYAGREESPVLTPLVAPGSECFLHVTPPQDIPARSSIKVLPIAPFLPLAFWLVELIINPDTAVHLDRAASPLASSSSSRHASKPLFGPWSDGFEDGGLVGLCYRLCEMILENYSLEEMSPSPLKEALLKIVSKLLTRITVANHVTGGSGGIVGGIPRPTPLRRQISASATQSQAKSLAILRGLHAEMVSLYAVESSQLVFTSYLQQLVDLLAASDELRPTNERLCAKFEFRAALTAEEKQQKEADEAAAAKAAEKAAATAIWVCQVCTFENVFAAPGCDMCGSPKPKIVPKKAPAVSDSSASSSHDSSAMFHDMMCTVGAMRLLNNEVRPEEAPAVIAMMESCNRDMRRELVEQRIVVIENVPAGEPDLVAAALARSLRQADGTLRIDPSQIFIGVDPTKEPIKEPKPVAPKPDAAGGRRPKANENFNLKSPGDECGVIFHIGSQVQADRNEPKWVNPATTSLVVATSSSVDSGSAPVTAIVGREPSRFATKNQPKQWVGIELSGATLILKKYTMRQAETSSSKAESPRSWKLEASTDGKRWTVVDERKNDGALSSGKNSVAVFGIKSTPQTRESYSHFRLTSTGPNAGNAHTLVIGGIELYGTLKKVTPKPQPFATPFYAVVQLNSTAMAEQPHAQPDVNPAAAQKALIEAIGRLTMPLHIRPPTSSKKADAPASDEPESKTRSRGASASADSSASSANPAFRSDEVAARQRASDERRKRLEDERKQRAQREREEEAAREEASRHVALAATPFLTLPNRPNHAVVNAYLRSRLCVSIDAELRPSNPPHTSKPVVKSWGRYTPTVAFERAVTALIRRHAGPTSETPSLSGQPALDGASLASLLAYAKLDANPALEKEVALLRKQASLPTGLECDLILQIMCRIAGAPAVRVQGATDVTGLSPPTPEYESGAFLLFEWLEDAGFDLNLSPHVEPRFEVSLALQQPTYWTNATASRSLNEDAAEATYASVDAEKFVDLLHDIAERVGEKDLLALQTTQIQLEEADWARIAAHTSAHAAPLPHLPLSALRLRFAFLRLFNRLFSSLLPLLDLRDASGARRALDDRSIASLVARCRPFLAPSVKNRFFGVILDATAEEAKTPQISVNRLALQMARTRGEATDFMRDSLFAKTFHQIYHKIDPFHLRPVRPQGTEPFLALNVQFRGEHVVGEGGPFRQLFTDLGRELMDATDIIQPTPNQTGKVGNERDKYILTPSATTSQHLQFYEYLGMLFGCCLRTGVRFPLDLSVTVWKSLLGEDLSASDLARVDAASMESLRFIESTTDEDALESIQQTFTTKLSDGSVVELQADGATTFVTLENKSEYVGLVVAARLTESVAQVDAIRRGLAQIVPIQLLNLFTPRDIELLICGRNTIDIDLLRRHTQYSGVEPTAPHIDMFWSVLHEFDQQQRRQFIQFAWAQERLPVDDAEFIRTHTRLLIKPSPYANPDKALPRSDTCFFNLELPAFSSISVLRSRLLYAIQSDCSMNGDRDSEADRDTGRGNNRRLEEDDY